MLALRAGGGVYIFYTRGFVLGNQELAGTLTIFIFIPRRKQMRLSVILTLCSVSLAILLPSSAIAGDECNPDPEEPLKPFSAEFGLEE